ncbi:TetR/AcrR family transcriptional regulator [Pediococcus argentinicus]|uniref:HTH tetR-type domain-containing protein n=1 Tax=Pediococcus argentinicus TaxID=480391 RepID=A0A0R2NGB7_9LACO|nr:TetR/AcrR family transcriptional regulator [Pediococcus argentinicus]KRO24881.1 hypothetical protein IV88_GL000544 [Pediococcus argentinicus]NKZ22578.1 TetR/AcrR family transcriptional regulator [Pediococcus argentinicus]GEP19761.1 TetR family transcriptional regulator [Pediococcus argentinicus]
MNNQHRRRGDELVNDIKKAALNILITDGYASVTFASVARQAHTSRSVLYHYWDTAFDLMLDSVHDGMINRVSEGDLDLSKRSLRDNLVSVGEFFLNNLTQIPLEFSQAMFYQLSQHHNKVSEILDDANQNSLSAMKHILEFAIEHHEIRIMPPLNTQLTLFQLIRYRFVVENQKMDRNKIKKLVDQVVLPAILEQGA